MSTDPQTLIADARRLVSYMRSDTDVRRIIEGLADALEAAEPEWETSEGFLGKSGITKCDSWWFSSDPTYVKERADRIARYPEGTFFPIRRRKAGPWVRDE